MGLSIGTLVRPFVDASYFTKDTDTNFQCEGDKTDVCVGIITGFNETGKFVSTSQDVYATVKWYNQCRKHKSEMTPKDGGWYMIDQLWEIGQVT